MLNDVTELRLTSEATVRDTIQLLDANRRQIALVMDDADRLLGVVTDGDIRRGMLRGVTLDSPVGEIMNASPRTGTPREPVRDLMALMKRYGIHHVPLLSPEGAVTGVFTLDDAMKPVEHSTPIVLMAGGKGTRLGALTRDTPKPMLEVEGTPLLELILRNLRAQGFSDIHISVNYLAHVITDYFGDGSALDMRIRYLHEDEPLGTAGALAALDGEIAEPFVVMNSDLLTRVSLPEMVSFHAKLGAKGTLGVREHLVDIPFGVVELDGSIVTAMVEKPTHRSLVNTGIYVLDPVALTFLERDRYADMPTLLGRLMEAGHDVAAFPIHESWLDVGRPDDLSRARADARHWTNL